MTDASGKMTRPGSPDAPDQRRTRGHRPRQRPPAPAPPPGFVDIRQEPDEDSDAFTRRLVESAPRPSPELLEQIARLLSRPRLASQAPAKTGCGGPANEIITVEPRTSRLI